MKNTIDILKSIDKNFILDSAKNINEKHIKVFFKNREDIVEKVFREQMLSDYREDVKLMCSLVEDYAMKRYLQIPVLSVQAIIFTLIYVVSPNDLIPDDTPAFGLMDDVAVLDNCLKIVRKDLDNYSQWIYDFYK